MKVTDYIVEFLIDKEITDIFGYPGGVICHLIDSLTKYPGKIHAHINYHEQASAFAACGYAQESHKLGVAFATSGPGATNLMTGIANAYFDSIPTLFITGQVDTYSLKREIPIRQCGFQETDIVLMVKPITKYAIRIDNPMDIRYELEKAYTIATSGNPGPVVIDLPADVQRAMIEVKECIGYVPEPDTKYDYNNIVEELNHAIKNANRPCMLIGNGVKQTGMRRKIENLIEKLNIPAVFSMPAFDILENSNKLNFGFIGANGHRFANFILGKSDLIVTIGTRMDLKQVGNERGKFAFQAKIIRIDIDEGNLVYRVHENEKQIRADIRPLLMKWTMNANKIVSDGWVAVCSDVRKKLQGYDDENYTKFLGAFCNTIGEDTIITSDVGQCMVWIAQQLQIKKGQEVFMSAGHGAMGYSLPAAIGAYYASQKPVYSFNGDGGIQMNIQELQFLAREHLPIKVVIINNRALGMIRGFQEANFEKNYAQTIEGRGYSVPDFKKIAEAYGLGYGRIKMEQDLQELAGLNDDPMIVELVFPIDTSLNPNFGRNGLIQDQRPYLNRALFDELMQL